MDEKLKPLLSLLADGRVHSGQSLGEALGVSRAAIWKQLGKLEEAGVAVQRVHGKGYCLATSLELLDRDAIHESLTPAAAVYLGGLQVEDTIDSTNAALLRQAATDARSGVVCLAERQLSGRGRRGRPWVSPYGCNLYLSFLWRYGSGASALEGLSLVAGLMVLDALESEGVPGGALKWPNDIVAGGKKLAGILLEMGGDPAGECHVVLGVGVNMAMPESAAAGIDQPWTDVVSLAGQSVSRSRLAAAIMNRVLPVLASYESQGFETYQDRWQAHDVCEGKAVRVLAGDAVHEGIGAGVDRSGAFRLQTDAGVSLFHGGEVSLRLSE